MPVRLLLTLLALSLGVPSARAEPGPCTENAEGVTTCGQGADALIVLPDTRSPSGKLAIGWRRKPGTTETYPDGDDVEDHIVRLADGKSLGLVVGRAWNTGEMRGNHIYLTTLWSPDSRWLVVGDGGKWSLEAMAVYLLEEGKEAARGQGLFRLLSLASKEALVERIGKERAESYLLDLAGNKESQITNAGKATLHLVFQVPKEDKDIELAATFKASPHRTGLAVTPIDVTFTRR